MKTVQINATCGSGSTGKICVSVSKLLAEKGIENYILYSLGASEYPLGIKCSDEKYIRMQALKARVLGNWGFNSAAATEKMIAELERISPDIVHLHNIHGHDCDLEELLSYLKSKNIKTLWTFHDCWAFTGYCMHFTDVGCDKWKVGCGNCPQKKDYSWLLDKSSKLYNKKKALYNGLDMTVVTPSKWLAELTKQSMLSRCNVKVINNGINLEIFKPTESDFKEKHGLADKKIILGVAFGWGRKKGLDVFIRLSKRLNDEYRIVLVGTDAEVDKQLPNNIISIHRTQNQTELAEIYSAADVFVNPSREENYPTVNMEALACGTPVVTFRVGGSAEMIDESCGMSVNVDDISAMEQGIKRFCKEKSAYADACLSKAKDFDADSRFEEYIELYKELYDGTAEDRAGNTK